ncbi:MAG: hypothetical protein R6X34_05130 [Chloroflexota bacterium]
MMRKGFHASRITLRAQIKRRLKNESDKRPEGSENQPYLAGRADHHRLGGGGQSGFGVAGELAFGDTAGI